MSSPMCSLIGAAELREMLEISESTLRRWLRDGRLPKPKVIGRKPYWSEAVIMTFMTDGSPVQRPAEQVDTAAEMPIGQSSADPCGKRGGERQ